MRWLLVVSALLLLGLVACSSEDSADQEQANVELVQRLFAEVWSGGNVELLDEIIADGYVKHWAAYPPTVGRDELKVWVTRLRNSFPDWNERIGAIHASGDMVFVRWTESGTFVEDLSGVPATNERISRGNGLDSALGREDCRGMDDDWGMQRQRCCLS